MSYQTRLFTGRTLRLTNAAILVAAALAFPSISRGQSTPIRPLFELFATYSRPPLAPGVADAYATAGGVKAGAGVGAAVGAMVGKVEVAGFFEYGTANLARAPESGRGDFTRRTGGVRMEVPLAELGGGYRGLVSGSVFVQQLGLSRVPESVNRGGLQATLVEVGQRTAPGARIELGVEHRGFIGTTIFLTGGVAVAGAGTGAWQDNASRRGGVGVAPVLTIGLRTREWM